MTLSRRSRRELILAMALAWLVLLSPVPLSLQGTGIVFAGAAVTCGAVLASATRWLAVRRSRSLDERELQLRGRSYRIAFRLLLPAAVIAIAAQAVDVQLLGHANVQLPVVFAPRQLVALLLFLVFAPTAVLAWTSPDAPEGGGGGARRLVAIGGTAALLSVCLWWFSVALLPTRTAVATRVPAGDFATDRATCGQFVGGEDAAYGFGSSLHMLVTACWDHRSAFAVDTPLSPPPYRMQSFAFPFISSCSGAGYDDFAQLKDVSCRASTDADGTLHYEMSGLLAPAGPATRWLRIELVLDRDGHVLRFG